MNTAIRLIQLLGVSEDELIQAIASQFAPPQPGALFGAWKRRQGYSAPESAKAIWTLLEDADFRCSNPECQSQLRLTIDHIDNDTLNSTQENLQILCFSCNRAKVGTPISKRLTVEVVRAIFEHIDKAGDFPTPKEITAIIGRRQLSGSRWLIKFLNRRFDQETSDK